MDITYFPILMLHHIPSHSLCSTYTRVLSSPRMYLTSSYHSNFAHSVPPFLNTLMFLQFTHPLDLNVNVQLLLSR